MIAIFFLTDIVITPTWGNEPTPLPTLDEMSFPFPTPTIAPSPLPSISVKSFALKVVNQSHSGNVYLMETEEGNFLKTGNILFILKEDDPAMAVRILRIYPEQKQFASREIRNYGKYEKLENNEWYLGVLKKDEFPLFDSFRNEDQKALRDLGLGEDIRILPDNPELDEFKSSSTFSSQKEEEEVSIIEEVEEKSSIQALPSPTPNPVINPLTTESISNSNSTLTPSATPSPSNSPTISMTPPVTSLETSSAVNESSLSKNKPEPQLTPLAEYDPDLDSGTSPIPEKKVISEETPSNQTTPAEPLESDLEKESEDLSPSSIEIEEEELKDPFQHWLTGGFGYVRNTGPSGGSYYFSASNLRYGYNYKHKLWLKSKTFQDSLTFEGGIYLYKALNYAVQGDAYNILALSGTLRYNVWVSSGFGVFAYAGLIQNNIFSNMQAQPNATSSLSGVGLAFGSGLLMQLGPSWYARLDVGYDSLSLNLLLRF